MSPVMSVVVEESVLGCISVVRGHVVELSMGERKEKRKRERETI